MTRPEIIRADSIDLQDQDAPSAQDHTRQPVHPAPLGVGPPAPHQAETLREKAAAVAEEHVRSPRVSKEWTNGDNVQEEIRQYGDDLANGVAAKLTGANLQQQDELAVAQNGGLTGSMTDDAEMADAEGDDAMDDDVLDKMSSSPSIDDGGCPLPQLWPQRSDPLERAPIRSLFVSQACSESSSPYVETPAHFPLLSSPGASKEYVLQPDGPHNHLRGEYLDGTYDESNYDEDQPDETSIHMTDHDQPNFGPYDAEFYSEYYATGDLEPNAEDVERELENLLPGYKSRLDEDFIDESYDEPGNIEIHAEHERGMTIPYEASEDGEDDDYDIPYSADSRFVDSGWGGECLQELEDIDFELVYALHTFVATVDGQANATKGDNMVLLDDSNSYWWLVRVVKDNSIGYLPAEHIETPTERLARLNKHRNIDLTSTMLGDQAEKTKNPLKKAIRRRNAKTVTFTAPTYVEAPDVDYSTDEEDMDSDFFGQNDQQEQNRQNGDEKDLGLEEEEPATVEPLKPKAEVREVTKDLVDTDAIRGDTTKQIDPENSRTSDDWPDGRVESRSKNGTVRNTDSFFKDDTVETRKITLTPNLLRDDSSTSTRTSNDSKEFKQRPSLDKLEKDSLDKKDRKDKKEKKEKDKKPGMLSGLFKRKEKKSKTVDDDVDESKRSTDNSRSSPVPSKDLEEAGPVGAPAPIQTQDAQRQPSKLQKQPRADVSPIRKPGQARENQTTEPQQAPAPERPPPAESVQSPSMRLVQPEASEGPIEQVRNISPELTRGPTPVLTTPVLTTSVTTPKEQKSGNAITKILRSASHSEPKPVKTKKAKARVELDDFDSSTDNSPVEEPTRAPSKQSQPPIPGSFPESYIGTPAKERTNPAEERLSESPIQISPVVAPGQSYPPALIVDTSSQEEAPSPLSSPSPELIDADEAREKKGMESSSTSASTPTWSDSHLRTFFDDEGDIRDLLVVVYDKSGVVPAGPDHPITGNLFREENAKLTDITNRLDGMLGDWLARKMRAQGTR